MDDGVFLPLSINAQRPLSNKGSILIMKRVFVIIVAAVVVGLLFIAMHWAGGGQSPLTAAAARSTETTMAFGNPEKVTVIGYSGPQEDPVISPDNDYLFFDSHNDAGLPERLYYARRVDYKTFQFLGAVSGANAEGKVTLRGNYDLAKNFYFVSQLCGSMPYLTGICHGTWEDGAVTNVTRMQGLYEPLPPSGGAAIFDVTVSPDGNKLYYSYAFLGPSGQPTTSQAVVVEKNRHGSFSRAEIDHIENVNATTPTIYNPALSPDGLTIVFTAPNLQEQTFPQVYVADRPSTNAKFGAPKLIAAANEGPAHPVLKNGTLTPPVFPENGGFSADGKYLYFHRVLGASQSQLYVLTRQ